MKDKSARDKAIENVMAGKLRARATAGNGCPDAEIIAAYFERTLAPKERTRWEAHFDSCAACQQRIAALVRMDEAGEASVHLAPVVVAPPRRKAFGLRWAWAAPAILAVLVAGLWYTGEFNQVIKQKTGAVTSAPKAASAPTETTENQLVNKKRAIAPPAAEKPRADAALTATADKAQAAGAKDELKPAMTASAETAGQSGKVQSPSPPPAPPAVDVATAKEEKARQATSASASEAGTGQTAPSQAEPPQPAATPLAAQHVTVEAAPQRVRVAAALENEGAGTTRTSGAEQHAPPRVESPETSAMKKPLAVAGGAGAESIRLKKAEKGGEAESPTAQFGLQALRSAPGFHYANAPGVARRDGATVPNALWRVGPHGLIEKQTGQGEWETKPSGVALDLYDISFASHQVGWAVGQDGTVLRSANAGKGWGRVASPTDEDLVRVRATSAESAEVTTRSGVVFRTTDGAVTWMKVETAQ